MHCEENFYSRSSVEPKMAFSAWRDDQSRAYY